MPACNALLHGDRGSMVPAPPPWHLLAALEENKLDDSKWRGSATPDKGPSCQVRNSGDREAVPLPGGFFSGFQEGVAVALLLICQGEFR